MHHLDPKPQSHYTAQSQGNEPMNSTPLSEIPQLCPKTPNPKPYTPPFKNKTLNPKQQQAKKPPQKAETLHIALNPEL